jgi:hypothetical protein
MQQHAIDMMSELGFSEKITVGIPCLEGKLDLVLPLEQVESLFRVKNPETGEPMFSRCHFLGLSDVSRKHKLNSRLNLAKMYGISVAMDACRTGAIFSNGSVGAQIASVLPSMYEKSQVMQHEVFLQHDYDREYRDRMREPVMLSALHDLLNEESVYEFWILYNLCMHQAKQPALTVAITPKNTSPDEALDKAFDLIGVPTVEEALLQAMKELNWDWFKSDVALKPLSYDLKRFETIRMIFDVNDETTAFDPSVDYSAVA